METSKQIHRDKERYVFLTKEDYDSFMKATEEFEFGILFKLTMLYGFRQRELIHQFKRSKINYEKETIEIAGKAGKRILPFFKGVKELLQKLEEKIEQNKINNVDKYCHTFSDNFCVDAFGGLIESKQLNKWLIQICEKAEILNIGFYTLRQTAIRCMEASGMPRHKVFEFAGHKPI